MNIYEEALEKYGEDAQLEMVVEECAELIKAIQKHKRTGNIEELCEEAADVRIMLNQLDMMTLQTEDELMYKIAWYERMKLARLGERLAGRTE